MLVVAVGVLVVVVGDGRFLDLKILYSVSGRRAGLNFYRTG